MKNASEFVVRFLGLLPLIALLTACQPGPGGGYEIIGYEVRTVEIVDVDYPKRFSVDIVDEKGNRFNGVAYSKRCNAARSRAIIGRSYQIPFEIGRDADGNRYASPMERPLNDLLCN